jgi:branched-chain amino acid transport system permease protein
VHISVEEILMTEFLQAVWGGILSGSVYGLMAIGLTLIWGAVRLLNLAHGALYVVGAYAAWTVLNVGLPLVAAIISAVLVAGAFGYAMHAVAIRPMLGRAGWDSASIIATVGIGIALQAAVLLTFGPRVKSIPGVVSGSAIVSSVRISYQGLVIIAVTVVALVALYYYLRSSRHGMAIRAVSQHMDAAALMGVPVERTFALVMILSAGLAGLAGVLLSSLLFLSPTSGFTPMIIALLVTIFGGLGSVKGTIVAAYVIGLIESSVQVYLGGALALPILYGFIILMLIVRPNGLFGVPEAQRL